MSFEAAEEAPVNMLLSGPAGGVAGALWVARQAGFDNVLTLDMGGASTDVCLIERGEPRVRRETMVGNVAVLVCAVGWRRRRLDREGARAHARVAGGTRERGRRARSGGLWPRRRAAHGYRRQRAG